MTEWSGAPPVRFAIGSSVFPSEKSNQGLPEFLGKEKQPSRRFLSEPAKALIAAVLTEFITTGHCIVESLKITFITDLKS